MCLNLLETCTTHNTATLGFYVLILGPRTTHQPTPCLYTPTHTPPLHSNPHPASTPQPTPRLYTPTHTPPLHSNPHPASTPQPTPHLYTPTHTQPLHPNTHPASTPQHTPRLYTPTHTPPLHPNPALTVTRNFLLLYLLCRVITDRTGKFPEGNVFTRSVRILPKCFHVDICLTVSCPDKSICKQRKFPGRTNGIVGRQ